MRRNDRNDLRIKENGSKHTGSSQFPNMEVLPKMKVLYEFAQYGNCVVISIKIHNPLIIHASQWQLLCINLFPDCIQITVKFRLFYFCFQRVSRKLHSNPRLLCKNGSKLKSPQNNAWFSSTFLLFLENSKFHLILKGAPLSQILQRLDKYVYIHREVASTQTHGSAFLPELEKFKTQNMNLI